MKKGDDVEYINGEYDKNLQNHQLALQVRHYLQV